jgi:hypothetical protein
MINKFIFDSIENTDFAKNIRLRNGSESDVISKMVLL